MGKFSERYLLNIRETLSTWITAVEVIHMELGIYLLHFYFKIILHSKNSTTNSRVSQVLFNIRRDCFPG